MKFFKSPFMRAGAYGNDFLLEGFGEMSGGEYDYVLIDGMGTLDANLTCNTMIVDGIFKNKGHIETTSFSGHGIIRLYSSLKAQNIDVSGVLKLRAVNIDCDTFYSEGILTADREICASQIIIMHDGFVNLRYLTGDKIAIEKTQIKNKIKNSFLVYLMKHYFACILDKNNAIINVIKCNELSAENITAGVINAKDIELKGNCVIGSVEYTKSFKADDNCIIKEVRQRRTKYN